MAGKTMKPGKGAKPMAPTKGKGKPNGKPMMGAVKAAKGGKC